MLAPGERWSLTTVRAILANPRYTGRQVWNRQPTTMDLIDSASTGLGHKQVQRWALPDGWVISARQAHPALISEETTFGNVKADVLERYVPGYQRGNFVDIILNRLRRITRIT